MIRTAIEAIGRKSLSFVTELGGITRFAGAVLRALVTPPLRVRPFLNEIFKLGVLSLVIICVSGLAVGMVLGLQGYNTLVRYGAEESLGTFVGLVLIRELGPVLSALLLTGRAASAAAAEIASMVVTEQLDGLRMMSIEPVGYVVAPKLLAFVVATPLLSALFIVLGLAGGYGIGVGVVGIDGGGYVSALQNAVSASDDVVPSLVKSLVFGVLIALIATFRGFHAEPHSAGVSRATTSTVVVGSVTILLVDYVLTALMGV